MCNPTFLYRDSKCESFKWFVIYLTVWFEKILKITIQRFCVQQVLTHLFLVSTSAASSFGTQLKHFAKFLEHFSMFARISLIFWFYLIAENFIVRITKHFFLNLVWFFLSVMEKYTFIKEVILNIAMHFVEFSSKFNQVVFFFHKQIRQNRMKKIRRNCYLNVKIMQRFLRFPLLNIRMLSSMPEEAMNIINAMRVKRCRVIFPVLKIYSSKKNILTPSMQIKSYEFHFSPFRLFFDIKNIIVCFLPF